MKTIEIVAKSMLVKSKLPGADYVVNPYVGCAFGCLYCYASFMGRFVKEPINNWGNYIYVKSNALDVFERDLVRLRNSGAKPSILLSSVTDPYQGVEGKYQLTRGILQILAREPYPGPVSILTKSPMVLRDVDILRQLPCVEVGMTVTTTDDKISRFLEVRAPSASRRIKALEALRNQGLETYAFVGPLLPHFRHEPAALEDLFRELARVGVGSVFVEHINLRPYIRERLFPIIDKEPAAVQSVYQGAGKSDHRKALDGVIAELLKKYGLALRLDQVLYHDNLPTKEARTHVKNRIPTNKTIKKEQ